MRTVPTSKRPVDGICRWFVAGFRFLCVNDSYGLIACLLALVAFAPVDASAAKQKNPRKEPVKGKTTSVTVPIQKLANNQARSALLRNPTAPAIDIGEKRQKGAGKDRQQGCRIGRQ